MVRPRSRFRRRRSSRLSRPVDHAAHHGYGNILLTVLQRLVHLLSGAVQPQQRGVQSQIFPTAQVRVEPRLLNERAYPAAGHRVPDRLAEDQRFPLGGPGQPAQELQGGGLARAVLADEAVDVPLLHP